MGGRGCRGLRHRRRVHRRRHGAERDRGNQGRDGDRDGRRGRRRRSRHHRSVASDLVHPAAPAERLAHRRVQVTASATDNRDTTPAIEVSVDGGAWAAYTAPVPVTADGAHTVRAARPTTRATCRRWSRPLQDRRHRADAHAGGRPGRAHGEGDRRRRRIGRRRARVPDRRRRGVDGLQRHDPRRTRGDDGAPAGDRQRGQRLGRAARRGAGVGRQPPPQRRPARHPTASFTAGWNSVDGLNDDVAPTSSGDVNPNDNAFVWGAWPQVTDQWVQYDWTEPVTVGETRGLLHPQPRRRRCRDRGAGVVEGAVPQRGGRVGRMSSRPRRTGSRWTPSTR